jgi:hypothetical protein
MESSVEIMIGKLLMGLKDKKKIRLSEASDILNIEQKKLDPILNEMEEKGIIEIKYPVIGEPQIVLKSLMLGKANIDIKKIEKIQESDMIFDMEKNNLKERLKNEIEDDESKVIDQRVGEVEVKVDELASDLENSAFRDDISEIMLTITGLRDTEKVSFYLKEVMNLISKMKEKRILTKMDKDFLTVMLKDITSNWKECGEQEIAFLFDDLRKKIETV